MDSTLFMFLGVVKCTAPPSGYERYSGRDGRPLTTRFNLEMSE
jgi:hypothetical protein